MMRFGNSGAAPKPRAKQPQPQPQSQALAARDSDTSNATATHVRDRSPRVATKPPLPEQVRRGSSAVAPAARPLDGDAARAATFAAAQRRTASPPQRENVRPSSSTTQHQEQQQQQQPSAQDRLQKQQDEALLVKLQAEQALTARIAELQALVAEWRKRRDAVQIVFMQENGSVERMQKTLEQINARIAKKKQLLAQHAPAPAATVDMSATSVEQQQQHHQNHNVSAAGTSASATTTMTAKRAEQATQCDSAFVSAVFFSQQLDAAHAANVTALHAMRARLLDAAVQRNVSLAQDVAALVQRVHVMKEELGAQLGRIQQEHGATSPAQVAAAERLVMSISLSSFGAADTSFSSSRAHDESGALLLDTSVVSAAAAEGDALQPEAVYRTVEKARLALAQALLPM